MLESESSALPLGDTPRNVALGHSGILQNEITYFEIAGSLRLTLE